jgi:hypothetical protein
MCRVGSHEHAQHCPVEVAMTRSTGRQPGDHGGIEKRVHAYIEAIPAAHRPLFDRLHGLILGVHPEAMVVLSYSMPTYKVGNRRLFLGAWKHGISIYGWNKDEDGGFVERHPELRTSTGTLRLRPEDAVGIADQEFADLFRAALGT